jgi:hypothetical protein
MIAMRTKAIVGTLAILIAVWGFSIVLNPLRQEEAAITAWLQKRTPVGNSYEHVHSYVEKKGWLIPESQHDGGVAKGRFLRVEVGNYSHGMWIMQVTAFWEFDTQDRLQAIKVWKHYRAP